jgi:glucose/arabinose dehydrogenase
LAVVDVANLEHPLAFAWRPGDDATYIADQVGLVYRLDPAGNAEVVLDLKARVTPFESGSERGLLGLTFGPDGRMYLDFTDQQSDTHVVSMAMAGSAPDPATEWEILFIDQPGFGHKAGTLDFDTAGNLYIASGDGAGSNGRDAQDPAKLLGAILRVKPNADGPGYTVPPDNPFANDPAIRPEKWVYGLRNPWRFTIDDETGEMWLGDVGKDEIEEVDRVPAGVSGVNFGWYWYEGSERRKAGAPEGVVPPVWEYSHQVGVSVIAGHVYRGAAIPALRGAFVFGDLTGIMWAFGADGVQTLPVRFTSLVAFGEGPDGELWLASHFGRVARLVPG